MNIDYYRLKEIIESKKTFGQSIKMTANDIVLFQSAPSPNIILQKEQYYSCGHYLDIDVFLPNKEFYSGKRPGILFFFGGGFKVGCKEAFRPQARELAKQGYIALCANYRTASTYKCEPEDSIKDGISAWKYMLENADRWNLDCECTAISGGSAGGLISLMCGIVSGIYPQALVLFNPAIIDSRVPALNSSKDLQIENKPLFSIDSLTPGMPPMLIQHGECDSLVPVDVLKDFSAQARLLGITCDLIVYPNMNHGFFQYHRSRSHYFLTLGQMLLFLEKIFNKDHTLEFSNLIVP